jgi:hypothetical protein
MLRTLGRYRTEFVAAVSAPPLQRRSVPEFRKKALTDASTEHPALRLSFRVLLSFEFLHGKLAANAFVIARLALVQDNSSAAFFAEGVACSYYALPMADRHVFSFAPGLLAKSAA